MTLLPDTLPAELLDWKEAIESLQAVVMLCQVDFPETGQALRLCKNNTRLVWPTVSTNEWFPVAMDVTAVKEATQKVRNTLNVTVSSYHPALADLYEEHNGFRGRTVRLYWVVDGELDKQAILTRVYRCTGRSESASGITFKLGELSGMNRREPHETFEPDFCPFTYGGWRCGYDTSRPGAIQTCSKRFAGKNGCTEHGEWEKRNNYPVIHPERFGGFRNLFRVRR